MERQIARRPRKERTIRAGKRAPAPRYKGAGITTTPRVGLSRSTLTTQLEDSLRADIVRGALAPGQRLTVGEVSRRYQVSPTPAREALARLAGEGFIHLQAQHSPQVAPLSLPEMRDLYDIRLSLEPQGLARSIQRADAAWDTHLTRSITELREAAERLGEVTQDDGRAMARWSGAHKDFHFRLFESAESPVLMRLVSILYGHSERYRLFSMRTPSIRRAFEEHDEIYRAAIARDEKAATQALREHLEGTVRLLAQAAGVEPPSART